MGVINNLNLLRTTYKNWLSMSFLIFRNRGKSMQIPARFRNGLDLTVERSEALQFALLNHSCSIGEFGYEIKATNMEPKVFLYSNQIKVCLPPGLVLDLIQLSKLHLFKLDDNSLLDLSNGILRFTYRGKELRLNLLKNNIQNGD